MKKKDAHPQSESNVISKDVLVKDELESAEETFSFNNEARSSENEFLSTDSSASGILPSSSLHVVRLIQQRMGPGFVHHEKHIFSGECAEVNAEVLLDVLRFLKRDPDADLELLVDLSCVDHQQSSSKGRFEIFYVLRSVRLPYQLSLHLFVDEENPEIPSISSLYPAADWLERELWDLFGIYADGHPHLRRILLYPGFTSHPMLQDYPSTKSQPLVPLRSPSQPTIVIGADGLEKNRLV